MKDYYLDPRNDVLEIMPKDAKRILDVGCGAGMLGKAIKNERGGTKEVIGIEINKEAAKEAQKNLDKVFVGDIETACFPLKKDYFDCIICADVIEHLEDPEGFLRRYRPYLKKDGFIVLSIPNVQFYHIILSLIFGRWEYQERGIMDKTHLRFFTLGSINQLMAKTGFKVEKVIRRYRLFEPYDKHKNLAKILSLYIFRDFFTFQYILICRKG